MKTVLKPSGCMGVLTRTGGALALGLLLALPASAQLSREGGRTQINSNELKVAERESRAVFIGEVDAVQGDARLRADTLTVNFAGTDVDQEGGGFGDIQDMLAEGNVYYVTPQLTARGNRGTYAALDETIVLTGDVVISRGDDIARGECLTLKVETGESTLGCGGKSEGGDKGRVTLIITPEERSE